MMNYKETVLFIGKCLTINHEEHNRFLVEEQLKSNTIDWDNVVRVSTGQFVFPTLYLNLKRACFLHYLPQDLVAYMQHITELNRERNTQLLEQSTVLNQLFKNNNLSPIFLKGTAFLVETLYEDSAERMIGDIDLLIDKNQIEKANILLKKNNYNLLSNDAQMPPNHRHIPRLVNDDFIGAIEIHSEMLRHRYAKHFNFNSIKDTTIEHENFSTLSFESQLLLSVLSKEINDFNYLYKGISLKNYYDIFLLSKKVDTLEIIEENSYFKKHINNVLAAVNLIFNNPTSIQFEENITTKNYVNSLFEKKNHKLLDKLILVRKSLPIFVQALYKKEYFNYVFKRLNS